MTEKTYKFYIGIDVAKAKLDVSISQNNILLEVANDEAGFKSLAKQLPNKKSSLIILEASGGYEKLVANYLCRKQYHVAVVNAKRIRDFAKASGKLAKTDVIDAQMIMAYGKAFNPVKQVVSLPNKDKRIEYINRRSQLVKMLTLEKQYLEKALVNMRVEILKHIDYLKAAIKEIEIALNQEFKQDPALNSQLANLVSIKGIGEITAMTVLTYMPELGHISSKAVAALAGVAPFNRDSGQMKGRREIWGGRIQVRSALYMATLCAKKYNPIIKKFYDHLIAKGKAKKVAIVACMHKLIIIMNAMMRDNSLWQPML